MLKQRQSSHHFFAKPIYIKKNSKNEKLSTILKEQKPIGNKRNKQQSRGKQSDLFLKTNLKTFLSTLSSLKRGSCLQFIKRKNESFIVQNTIKQKKQSNLNQIILNSQNYQLIKQSINPKRSQSECKQSSKSKNNKKLSSLSVSSNLISSGNMGYPHYRSIHYKTQRRKLKNRSIDNMGNKYEVKGWEQAPFQTNYHLSDLF